MAKSNSDHSLGLAPIVAAFDHVWLLVSLVHLDAYARGNRRGWNDFGGCDLVNWSCTCGGGRSSRSLVQTSGIGRRHIALLGIERIAQRELYVTLGTGQRQTLRVVWRDQQRDHSGILR